MENKIDSAIPEQEEVQPETERKLVAPKISKRQIRKLIENPNNKQLRESMDGQYITKSKNGYLRKYLVVEDGSLVQVHIKTLQPINEENI